MDIKKKCFVFLLYNQKELYTTVKKLCKYKKCRSLGYRQKKKVVNSNLFKNKRIFFYSSFSFFLPLYYD
jgi:hypothetical protein